MKPIDDRRRPRRNTLTTSTGYRTTMTQLETAIAGLMKTFDTYAAGEGNKDTLSKAETKTLLEKELPSLIKAAKNQAALTCAAHNRTCKK
ncbi:unnamed protein product [Pleuronectes platessa]|uniref:S100/CaBP-9k-type calcium binding subdomain domain-containing protein n=1 Tax=Pleuronectes platessa TaxID=8262 RepID=A0A9N7UX93_PLEPL|nr:unnamed protein product [Pleuronectes platessa]